MLAAAEIKEAAAVTESVQTKVGGQFAESALRSGGTLEYSFRTTSPVSTSPKVTRAVEVDLSESELAAQPKVTNVVVSATVDAQGVPHDVKVTRSAGSVVDQKAIAAVSQYRFIPATVDKEATWAQVSIAIKIQKQ
jgi:TonB family protein